MEAHPPFLQRLAQALVSLQSAMGVTHSAEFDLFINPQRSLIAPDKGEDKTEPPAPESVPYFPQPVAILDDDYGADADSTFTDNLLDAAPAKKLRGIKLVAAVYNELANQLGKVFSPAELLDAAQRLVDLSKLDFVGPEHKGRPERAGYYSWDLVKAFEQPWYVTKVEEKRFDHCDVEEFAPESVQSAKLLLQGWNDALWEF